MTYPQTITPQRPTLQDLALERIQGRLDTQRAKEASAQAENAYLRQEHPNILRIFQRDILQGSKLPAGVRVDSIVHGHRISVLYAYNRSIVGEHLFKVVDDRLVIPIFGGLIQRWIAKKYRGGFSRTDSFDDFLDAFIWLFYDELVSGATGDETP